MRGPCGGDREAQAKIHGALIAGVEGRRALVAGGASGIGAASAARLAELGAEVVIADIDAANGERVSREIGAQFLAVDLIEYDAPARALALNLEAALNVIHVVLPAMQKGGYGRVVHVASEAGRLGTKGGVIAFTRLIAHALDRARERRFGITANVVAPGSVDTPMPRRAAVEGGQKRLAAMTSATLPGRLGQPEKIAPAVAFLASQEAAFIIGEVLGVSGGMGCGA